MFLLTGLKQDFAYFALYGVRFPKDHQTSRVGELPFDVFLLGPHSMRAIFVGGNRSVSTFSNVLAICEAIIKMNENRLVRGRKKYYI